MISEEIHQCKYCEFNGIINHWKKQPYPFFQMTLLDTLIAKGKLEYEYICPKCGHTLYIAEVSDRFKIALYSIVFLLLFIVSVYKITE